MIDRLTEMLAEYHGKVDDFRQRTFNFDTATRRGSVRLVGLWSPAPQSGKSTAADALVDSPLCATKVSFATPLRVLVANLLRTMDVSEALIRERVWCGVDKELPIPGVGKSVVELLILIGTKVGREQISETIWVDAGRRAVERAFDEGAELVVIDDVRFRNEASMIRDLGGVMLGIERPSAPPPSAQRAAAEGHLTRADMDALVLNDTGKAIYEARVIQTARLLGVDL